MLATIFVTSLAIVGMAWVNYRLVKNLLIQNQDAQTHAIAQIAESLLDARIKGITEQGRDLATRKQTLEKVLQATSPRGSLRLRAYLLEVSEATSLSAAEVIVPSGKVLTSTRPSFSETKNSEERMAVSWAIQGKPIPARFVRRGEEVFLFSSQNIALDHAEGSEGPYAILNIWAPLNGAWAYEAMSLIKMQLMLALDGKIVVSSLRRALGAQVLDPRREGGPRGSLDASFGSIHYRLYALPIGNPQEPPIGTLIIANDTNLIQAALKDSVHWLLLTVIASWVGLSVFVFFLTSLQIGSLKRLVASAQVVTRKGPEHFLPAQLLASDSKEIQELATSFNIMVRTLSEQFRTLAQARADLEEMNKTLEQRVREKTEQLEKSMAALIQADKMAALGTMAGGVAHEINNPLAIILINAGQLRKMLESESNEDSRIGKMLATIETTGKRIAKIVAGLRSFSREGKEDPFQSVSLQEIVDTTLALCRERLRDRAIDLRVHAPETEVRIECRATQIQQVLINLLNNAFDAVVGLPERWIEVTVESTDDEIIFRVTDSGAGIPEGMRKMLFQPFFTTKPVGKGTGLGLSVSKGLIESHRGSLWLDSDHPRTSFVVRLPKLQPETTENG